MSLSISWSSQKYGLKILYYDLYCTRHLQDAPYLALVDGQATDLQCCDGLLDSDDIDWHLWQDTLENVGVDIWGVRWRLDGVVRNHIPGVRQYLNAPQYV